jgi:hypothetical protein
MGFSNEAAAILTDATKENLEVHTLQYLDDKGIKILCASLRKPGGTTAGVAPAGGGAVPQVPNPGVYVSTRAEINIAAACYMARCSLRSYVANVGSTGINVSRHSYICAVQGGGGCLPQRAYRGNEVERA